MFCTSECLVFFFVLHRIALTLNSCSCNNLLSLQSLCTQEDWEHLRGITCCVYSLICLLCVCADQNVCLYTKVLKHTHNQQCCCSQCIEMLCSLCLLDFFARSCSHSCRRGPFSIRSFILSPFCFSASAKCIWVSSVWKISARFFLLLIYLCRYRIRVCFELQSRREKEQAKKSHRSCSFLIFFYDLRASFFSYDSFLRLQHTWILCCSSYFFSSLVVCVCVFCIRGESPAIKILWLNVLLCAGVAIMIGYALPKWT